MAFVISNFEFQTLTTNIPTKYKNDTVNVIFSIKQKNRLMKALLTNPNINYILSTEHKEQHIVITLIVTL